MAFDPKLDQTLDSEIIEGEGTSVEVSLRRYGDGDPKVQLSRFSTEEDGQRRYRKLGRLTLEEAESVWDTLGRFLVTQPHHSTD